jgi:hypothetical protein
MKLTPLLLSAGLLLSASLYGADLASDSGSNFKNPWGPANPQNPKAEKGGKTSTGFADWIFSYSQTTLAPDTYFIDQKEGAFGITVTDDDSYDGVYVSFTGDGQIDVNQSYVTDVLFTPPGTYSSSQTPTEGLTLLAQSPTVPPNPKYNKFGHQVLGLYCGPTSAGVYQIGLGIHNTLSDEDPNKWIWLPWSFTGTDTKPMAVHIDYKQLAGGNWKLELSSPGKDTLIYSSASEGTLWNTTTGIDGVQYFTSQGSNSTLPAFEWKSMSVK